MGMIEFDTQYDIRYDINKIIYNTITEYEGADHIPAKLYSILAAELTERILDYLRSSEGIPT